MFDWEEIGTGAASGGVGEGRLDYEVGGATSARLCLAFHQDVGDLLTVADEGVAEVGILAGERGLTAGDVALGLIESIEGIFLREAENVGGRET